MSLQAILEAIHASGRLQVLEIEQQAQAQAGEILAAATSDSRRIEAEARAIAAAPAGKERARIIHRAHLEALQATGSAREALVDAALKQIREHLAGTRFDATYPEVQHRLVREALAELQGSLEDVGRARLEADPRDRALMEDILRDLRLDLSVSYVLSCWGGLVAKSEDGRVIVINTLEVRLERATPFLRQYLSGFFEAEQLEASPSQVIEEVTAI